MEQIPRHHRLIRTLFYQDPHKRQAYGTSHIRAIIDQDNLQADREQLDELEERVYQLRKNYIEHNLGVRFQGEQVVGVDEGVFSLFYIVPTQSSVKYYLSHKLSLETIETLRPLYETVRTTLTVQSGMDFLRAALSLRDYIVNIMYIHFSFFTPTGVNGHLQYTDPLVRERNRVFEKQEIALDEWTYQFVHRITSAYITPVNQKNRYATEGEHYKVIPAGTRLCRGFKQQRGPLNKERGFSFFVWDAIDCIDYSIPSEDETMIERNEENEGLSQLEMYCRRVGGVVEVATRNELRLLDMSRASTVRHLLGEMKERGAPNTVIRFFREGYILCNNDDTRYCRKSVYHKDMEVVKWLMNNGFDGYMAMDVEGLHDEIVIFNINHTVDISRIYTSDDFNIHHCTPPYLSLGLMISDA